MQRKYNLNRNYNLMGFDIIEIHLVSISFLDKYAKIHSNHLKCLDLLPEMPDILDTRVLTYYNSDKED